MPFQNYFGRVIISIVFCLQAVGSENEPVVFAKVKLNGAVDNYTVTAVGKSWDEFRKDARTKLEGAQRADFLGTDWWLANKHGSKVKDWEDLLALTSLEDSMELSAIPADRYFQWGVEEIQSRIFVRMNDSEGVELEPISRHPRIFIVHNFFSEQEASQLISSIANKTGDDMLKRSGVGKDDDDDYSRTVSNQRTSDNGFDDESPVAQALLKRCFDLVRLEYDEDKADGVQILRYNKSAAYISHTDWFDDDDAAPGQNLDPRTSPPGSNRWATIILYLKGPDSGGFTVFPLARLEENVVDTNQVSTGRDLNAMADARRHRHRLFKKGTWQAKLVTDCYSKLAVKPSALNAVLFYHQDPLDGSRLPETQHGGCPSFEGVKWAANVWIWNGNYSDDSDDDDEDGDEDDEAEAEENEGEDAEDEEEEEEEEDDEEEAVDNEGEEGVEDKDEGDYNADVANLEEL